MVDLSHFSCRNLECQLFNETDSGNIAVRARYGPKQRTLLYCKVCGKTFAATSGTALSGSHLDTEIIHQIIHHAAEGVGVRATSRLLNISKETVNNVIYRVGLYCANLLSEMIRGLEFNEIQLDELWSFIKKKNVMSYLQKRPRKVSCHIRKVRTKEKTTKEQSGSGHQ